MNNGTAIKTKQSPFCQCECPNGFTGTYCEKGINNTIIYDILVVYTHKKIF